MAGRVEQVHDAVPVRELEHGRGDRDAALLLELHPVRGGRAPALPRLDRPGAGGQRAAVEQELLGEGGLAGVGVRDDRERAAPGRLRRHPGGVGSGRVHDRPSVPGRASGGPLERRRAVLVTSPQHGSTPERRGTADRTSSVLSPPGRLDRAITHEETASPMSSPITTGLSRRSLMLTGTAAVGLPLLAGPRSILEPLLADGPTPQAAFGFPEPDLTSKVTRDITFPVDGTVSLDRHLRRLSRRVLAPPRGPGPHGAEAHPAGGVLRRHGRRPQPRVGRQQHLHRGRRRLVLRVPPHQQRHALHRRRRQPHRVGVRGRHDRREPGGPGPAHRLRRRQRQRRVHRVALPLRDPQAHGLRGLELAGGQRRSTASTAAKPPPPRVRARDLRAVGQLARPRRPAVRRLPRPDTRRRARSATTGVCSTRGSTTPTGSSRCCSSRRSASSPPVRSCASTTPTSAATPTSPASPTGSGRVRAGRRLAEIAQHFADVDRVPARRSATSRTRASSTPCTRTCSGAPPTRVARTTGCAASTPARSAAAA